MPRFVVEVQVDAAPDQVFSVFTDLNNAAERMSSIENIEMLSSGPTGIGTRWRETRRFGRHEAVEEMEFIEYVPGKSFAVRCDSHGTRYLTRYLLTPGDGSTRVTVDFDAKPVTVTAKLLSPLGRIMFKSVEKCVRQDLEELKEFAQAEAKTRIDPVATVSA